MTKLDESMIKSSPLDAEEAAAISRNLFRSARRLLTDNPHFRWHRDRFGRITASQIHSSQALAIDVLWTVRSLSSRDLILNEWCRELGLPYIGCWTVELENVLDTHLLGEPRPTQLDAVARSDAGLLVFECKFTESDGGACSQTEVTDAGKRPCNGNYELQTNPLNGKRSPCALTAKGVRYWELIPQVLSFDPSLQYKPCPFSGGWYQWMRNLVASLELGRASGLPVAFVVLYAAGNFPMARRIEGSTEWSKLKAHAVSGRVPLVAASYQYLIDLARRVANAEDAVILCDLAEWIANKTRRAGGRHDRANSAA
jgi:hypothetical protein